MVEVEFSSQFRRDFAEQLRLQLGEMRQRATHASGRVMFRQAIGGQDVREAVVAEELLRGETVEGARGFDEDVVAMRRDRERASGDLGATIASGASRRIRTRRNACASSCPSSSSWLNCSSDFLVEPVCFSFPFSGFRLFSPNPIVL